MNAEMKCPETPRTEPQKAKAKVLTSSRLVVIVLLLAILIVLALLPGYRWRARAEQYRTEQIKDSIAHVQELSGNKQWIDKQHEQVKTTREWLSDNFMLMRNGEWLVYQNRCSKEDSKAPVRLNLFIGKGSDGKWYCSTWHFCVGMLNLRMDGQPESLAVFQIAYYAEPFDSTAKNCPKDTWRYDTEYEIRGGTEDSDMKRLIDVFRAEVKDTTWKRVRILAYNKVYELDDKQLAQLQGFPPRSSSGCGSERSYSFVRTVTSNGIAAEQEVKIIIGPNSGLTIERR
jgi:hypothetical protein